MCKGNCTLHDYLFTVWGQNSAKRTTDRNPIQNLCSFSRYCELSTQGNLFGLVVRNFIGCENLYSKSVVNDWRWLPTPGRTFADHPIAKVSISKYVETDFFKTIPYYQWNYVLFVPVSWTNEIKTSQRVN